MPAEQLLFIAPCSLSNVVYFLNSSLFCKVKIHTGIAIINMECRLSLEMGPLKVSNVVGGKYNPCYVLYPYMYALKETACSQRKSIHCLINCVNN